MVLCLSCGEKEIMGIRLVCSICFRKGITKVYSPIHEPREFLKDPIVRKINK